MFNGARMGLGSMAKLSDAVSRSISAENVYGEKGKGGMALPDKCQEEVKKIGQGWNECGSARELGQGWKCRPCIPLPAGTTTTIMDVKGPGVIQHMWFTLDANFYRDIIVRMYWDEETEPSVETPIGDFFCNAYKTRANILALPINVNPNGGFNSFFPMPFRKHARVTVENLSPDTLPWFFYTINYSLTKIDDDDAYFHAQFRRANPLPYGQDYVIAADVKGKGHYVGTYIAWQQNNAGWWGEGEIKMFLDGDTKFPTICGTGTEDYFGGAWCFGSNYTAPFMGYPAGVSDSKPGNRHSLYRFHVMDPVRFHSDLKVTMQAIGWRSGGRYLPLQDDISSVVYWYQTEPHNKFPKMLDRNGLEII